MAGQVPAGNRALPIVVACSVFAPNCSPNCINRHFESLAALEAFRAANQRVCDFRIRPIERCPSIRSPRICREAAAGRRCGYGPFCIFTHPQPAQAAAPVAAGPLVAAAAGAPPPGFAPRPAAQQPVGADIGNVPPAPAVAVVPHPVAPVAHDGADRRLAPQPPAAAGAVPAPNAPVRGDGDPAVDQLDAQHQREALECPICMTQTALRERRTCATCLHFICTRCAVRTDDADRAAGRVPACPSCRSPWVAAAVAAVHNEQAAVRVHRATTDDLNGRGEVRVVHCPFAFPAPADRARMVAVFPNAEIFYGNRVASHGLLAMQRRYGEAQMIHACRQLVDVAPDMNGRGILSVGGSPLRTRNEADVWCACPRLLEKDDIRIMEYVGLPNWCTCRAELCPEDPQCRLARDGHFWEDGAPVTRFKAAIFTHSLYYVPAAVTAHILSRTTTHRGYSLTHQHNDAAGSFERGEATYTVTIVQPPDKGFFGEPYEAVVVQNTRGEAESYTHTANLFVYDPRLNGHTGVTWRGEYGHPPPDPYFWCHKESRGDDLLGWAVKGHIGSMTTHKLFYVPQAFRERRRFHEVADFSAAVTNPGYWGDVAIGSPFSTTRIEAHGRVGAEVVKWRSAVSFGSWIVLMSEGAERFALPRGLLAEGMQFMAFRRRDKAEFTRLVNHLKAQVLKANYPLEASSRAFHTVVALSFVRGMSSELRALDHIAAFTHHIDVYNAASLLEGPRNFLTEMWRDTITTSDDSIFDRLFFTIFRWSVYGLAAAFLLCVIAVLFASGWPSLIFRVFRFIPDVIEWVIAILAALVEILAERIGVACLGASFHSTLTISPLAALYCSTIAEEYACQALQRRMPRSMWWLPHTAVFFAEQLERPIPHDMWFMLRLLLHLAFARLPQSFATAGHLTWNLTLARAHPAWFSFVFTHVVLGVLQQLARNMFRGLIAFVFFSTTALTQLRSLDAVSVSPGECSADVVACKMLCSDYQFVTVFPVLLAALLLLESFRSRTAIAGAVGVWVAFVGLADGIRFNAPPRIGMANIQTMNCAVTLCCVMLAIIIFGLRRRRGRLKCGHCLRPFIFRSGPDPAFDAYCLDRVVLPTPCCTVYSRSQGSLPMTVTKVAPKWPELPASVHGRVRIKSSYVVDPDFTTLREFYCPGLVFNHSPPVVYQPCLTNELVSVCNRALAITHPLPEVVADFSEFVDAHMDRIFPDARGCLSQAGNGTGRTPFSEWNARFPAGRAADHAQARKEAGLETGYDRHAFKRKTFVKSNEKMLKIDDVGFDDSAPRTIQGGADSLNIVLGPWFHGFSNALAAVWHPDHFITYTSGLDQKALGSKFAAMRANPAVFAMMVLGDDNLAMLGKFFENDFGKFDASVSVGLLEVERKVYQHFGMPRHILDLERKTDETYGATPHGVSYAVPATRKSGHPNTSCGNSLLNGLVLCYALYRAGLLDERLQLTREVVDSDVPDIAGVLENLGLRPEPQVRHHSDDAEFCSGIFIPTSHGCFYVPKPGKLLAKFGYYVNPPTYDFARAVALADARALVAAYGFVPVYNIVGRHAARIAAATEPRSRRTRHDPKQADKVAQYLRRMMEAKPMASALGVTATAETYDFFHRRYGWHATDYETLDLLLSKATHGPVHIGFEPVRAMTARDVGGCLN